VKRFAASACAVLVVSVLACSASQAADYVWMEGENPTRRNFEVRGVGWGNQDYLSEGAWLNIVVDANQVEQKLPEGGILLEYDFQAPSAGRYEVWNRIGYEFVRSVFDWRLDDGEWQRVAADQLTTDLMDISFWCEVAWVKMADAQLSAGEHTLSIRHPLTYAEKEGKKEPQRVLSASDALCLYKGKFRPNSKFKPDQDWQEDADREAAAQTFQVEAAPLPERIAAPLSGLWQIARADEQVVQDRLGPIKETPPAEELFWKAVNVPADRNVERPEMIFCHRYFYRTRVEVPAGLEGRSFFLHFPSTNMVATVFVNGRMCGWNKAPFAAWDCDVTGVLRPGQVNEVWVGMKDTYYGLAGDTRRSFNLPTSVMDTNQGTAHRLDMPVWHHRQNGILEPPELIVTGPAYTADVFAMPSVKKKELALEVTVKNPADAPVKAVVANEVEPLGGGAVEKRFESSEVTIPARGEAVLKIAEAWENPKLWWPDSPQQYNVVTRLTVGGAVTDVRRTKFGFREWEWEGTRFVLNGVPWQGRADLTHHGTRDPEAAVRTWREHGQTMFRFWATHWGGMTQPEALDFLDAAGVPVRRSGIFDGEMASYGLAETVERDGERVRVARKDLFDNWIHQIKAWVRAERNHPSIFIWSIENEITFINAMNLGNANVVEPEMTRAVREVMAVDPTRPAMVDGGRALLDKSLPVNGCHYNEPAWRDLPDESYGMEKSFSRPHRGRWPLREDAPAFFGEAYYAVGNKPSAFAIVGGERAFIGRSEARLGVDLVARMMSEGYRWMGLAAFHFWMSDANTLGQFYTAWQPVCVLSRQWNWTFGGGSKIARTLKVFNDTRYPDPITMAWELKLDGRTVASDRRTFRIPPGLDEQTEISFDVPAVKERTAGEFILTCERGGEEVFRDVKPVWVIDPDAAPKPRAGAGELCVLDPQGAVKNRLNARGIPFAEIAGLADVPESGKVIVVGKNALTGRQATDPGWQRLAAQGRRILVLDQDAPLRDQAVPADLEPSGSTGRIAFSENLNHPAFDGLDQPDFFTWSGDHVVYRNVYKKASGGAKSLAQCDAELGYSALSECAVSHGLMLLSQFAIGDKLGSDPVAQRLFDNMLNYCFSYELVQKRTASVIPEGDPLDTLLSETGLRYGRAADVLGAMADARNEIVVAQADPATLKALAGNAAAVKTFTDRGGWMMLFGLMPEGLKDFNRVVGVDHLLRPFEMERVTMPAVRDPLMSGLTTRDVVMESGQRIYSWQADRFMAGDVFTCIVDFDDIAPFCKFPGPEYWKQDEAQPGGDHWPRNMINGFITADSWRYCFSILLFNEEPAKWTIELPRREEVIGFSIVPNAIYHQLQKVRLIFDDDQAGAVELAVNPESTRQDFEFDGRKASRLTIDLAEWDPSGSQEVVGVDNLWVKVKRPVEFYERVKPLLNIGGLVKYPMGRGGIVLNQLRILATESVPVNDEKKRTIISTLLRNLGATFTGGETELVAGVGLDYFPVPLEDKCNRFLTRGDDPWFKNTQPRDMGHFAPGEAKYAAVTYHVRDFKTSPLPSCIVLNGRGNASVTGLPDEVKGIPVGRKADALFFLHAFNQYGEPDRRREPNPVVFQYTVHYAGGETAVIPVSLDLDVAHWVSRDPTSLKNGVLAWAAPFPNDDSGDQAAVYQLQWNNPRPDAAVESLDVGYGEAGNRYGQPALLAVTAATATE